MISLLNLVSDFSQFLVIFFSNRELNKRMGIV